jgi:nitroreductase
MEFQEVVRRRRMVRAFEPEPLDAAVVERILRNAHQAPSAGFSQGYAFLVLEGQETGRFWRAVRRGDGGDGYKAIAQAPLLVIPLASKDAYLDRYSEPDKGWTDRDEARWPVPFWYIDTGFTVLLMLLTAVDAGLGAVFFGIPPSADGEVRAEFGIPDDHDPIGVVAIGRRAAGERPVGSAVSRPRRPLDEVVHRGTFQTRKKADGTADGAG